jgi:NADH:ubiquinone oxidoreductase subunit 6 (subunit J)
MNLFALSPTQQAGGQIALAALLGGVGFYLLLPRPRGRFVSGGIAALVAAVAVFGAWLHSAFGDPLPDLVGTLLFVLFSAGALGFGTVLVVQRNPARGAIAFAFVILSTCGLFLLLAAPFLMAATIIIYAGAIIVTFLFVLMLSSAEGPSDENDRSREPLYGSLAGFAFVGLVLFTLYQTSQAAAPGEADAARLPAPVLTAEERALLTDAITKLEAAEKQFDGDAVSLKQVEEFENLFLPAQNDLSRVVGADVVGKSEVPPGPRPEEVPGSLRLRLEKSPGRDDRQAREALARAETIRTLAAGTRRRVNDLMLDGKPDVAAARAEVRHLRDEVLLLRGTAELPARNVGNLGLVLYTDHLLAVELAGTLLLVATIGAVAIAQRKGVAK